MEGTKHIENIYWIQEEKVNVSSRVLYLEFAFKNPKYVKNRVFC